MSGCKYPGAIAVFKPFFVSLENHRDVRRLVSRHPDLVRECDVFVLVCRTVAVIFVRIVEPIASSKIQASEGE